MRAGPELAWRQLIAQKGHFSAALAGVAFAVTLMLGQIGLRDSLLATAIRLYSHLRADIVMTSWEYQFAQSAGTIPRIRIEQAMAVEGVESCLPLQIGWLNIENPEDHEGHQIIMLGFDPERQLFDFDGQQADFRPLTKPGSLVFDASSRSIYGPIAERFKARAPLKIMAARREAEIVGTVAVGPGFGNDGYVFASDSTFGEFSPVGSLPSIGAIRLRRGADRWRVMGDLRALLPGDVRFTAMPDFLEGEKEYWLKTSPIGFLFTAGLVLGIVVGAVVVYQILYTDVTNHLAEYATMKAMGYRDGALFRMVVMQAVYLSVLGFIPGALMAKAIFMVTHRATLLPFEITMARLAEVYGLTFVMCTISGGLAMRALKLADPAEIF